MDYSKRGTAKCKKCRNTIKKGELRMGKSVAYKTKYFLQYFHIRCMFETFRAARSENNVISSAMEIDGIEEITGEEKLQILNLIDETNAFRNKISLQQTVNEIQTTDRISDTVQSENTVRKSLLITTRKNPSTRATFNNRRKPPMQSNLPVIPVLFTNADQLTSSKKIELQNYIEKEKPLIIGVSEVKPKNAKERVQPDYEIPGYSLHPVNLEQEVGRGVAVYTHKSIEKSVVQITSHEKFEEASIVEIRLRGGDMLLFGCLYRSPTVTISSDENNDNLNNLIQYITKKNYSHICLVGDINFKDINWESWTSPHNEESKESKFMDTIRSCYLHQHMSIPTRRRGNDSHHF